MLHLGPFDDIALAGSREMVNDTMLGGNVALAFKPCCERVLATIKPDNKRREFPSKFKFSVAASNLAIRNAVPDAEGRVVNPITGYGTTRHFKNSPRLGASGPFLCGPWRPATKPGSVREGTGLVNAISGFPRGLTNGLSSGAGHCDGRSRWAA